MLKLVSNGLEDNAQKLRDILARIPTIHIPPYENLKEIWVLFASDQHSAPINLSVFDGEKNSQNLRMPDALLWLMNSDVLYFNTYAAMWTVRRKLTRIGNNLVDKLLNWAVKLSERVLKIWTSDNLLWPQSKPPTGIKRSHGTINHRLTGCW